MWFLWRKVRPTRMHSSRMRTVRCGGRHEGGGGCVSAQGDVCPGCLSMGGGGSARHPSVDRMIDTCKNTTCMETICA